MGWCPEGDKLDQALFDAITDFFALVLQRGERLSEEFGVPAFCIKAMHRLDDSLSLKELGKRMHCDPSFVTMIADMLEERGLARREPSTTDRRIKNLVLTPGGVEVKTRLEHAILGQMPWAGALDTSERETLLALIRKMVDAAGGAPEVAPSALAGEVIGTSSGSSPEAP